MASCKPQNEKLTEITLNGKTYYVDENQVKDIEGIIGYSPANPFWTTEEIYRGAEYYWIDDFPSYCEGEPCVYEEYQIEKEMLRDYSIVKSEKFARIQYWREMLYRRLAFFKYQNDDRCKLATKDDKNRRYWSILTKTPLQKSCEEIIPDVFTDNWITPRVGEVCFTSEEIAQRAIDEVIYPTMQESGLDEEDQMEILRVL